MVESDTNLLENIQFAMVTYVTLFRKLGQTPEIEIRRIFGQSAIKELNMHSDCRNVPSYMKSIEVAESNAVVIIVARSSEIAVSIQPFYSFTRLLKTLN